MLALLSFRVAQASSLRPHASKQNVQPLRGWDYFKSLYLQICNPYGVGIILNLYIYKYATGKLTKGVHFLLELAPINLVEI
jgi:hypothetical protein